MNYRLIPGSPAVRAALSVLSCQNVTVLDPCTDPLTELCRAIGYLLGRQPSLEILFATFGPKAQDRLVEALILRFAQLGVEVGIVRDVGRHPNVAPTVKVRDLSNLFGPGMSTALLVVDPNQIAPEPLINKMGTVRQTLLTRPAARLQAACGDFTSGQDTSYWGEPPLELLLAGAPS